MNTYQRAVEKWGAPKQLDKAVEECGELITAIMHFKEGRATAEEVAGEVADVEIMCEQVREIIGHRRVDAARTFKKNRLEKRVG